MRIIVWYHCILTGPRIHNEDHAVAVLQEQMGALSESGLAAHADEIHIGINGTDRDSLLVCAFCPPKSELHVHGSFAQTELSTLHQLRQRLQPGQAVLYHHIKGVQYPNSPVWDRWRRCMERACVWNWRQCIDELERGSDSVGAHWMTQDRYPMVGKGQRYWGGNFWWARSDYLMSLPAPAFDEHDRRYDAEVWIGSGKRAPRVIDFARHFPMNCPA